MAWLGGACTSNVAAESPEPIDGFIYPFRTINVSSVEVGILTSVDVEEGDAVAREDVLATLDRDVLDASLAVAKQAMQSRGALESAKAEVKLAEDRLSKLEELASHGHARPDEVDRARTNLDVALAQQLLAEETLTTRRLEVARIQAQISRRVIHSPIDGVVAQRLKQVGEHVAPTSPEVITIVQLEPLLAKFTVPVAYMTSFAKDAPARIRLTQNDTVVRGVVHTVSPLIQAESGTVRVEIRMENPNGELQSGQACVLLLPEMGAE